MKRNHHLTSIILAAALLLTTGSAWAATLHWGASSGEVTGYKVHYGTNASLPGTPAAYPLLTQLVDLSVNDSARGTLDQQIQDANRRALELIEADNVSSKLKREIIETLPFDAETVSASLHQGVPFTALEPRAEISKKFELLGRKVLGFVDPDVRKQAILVRR